MKPGEITQPIRTTAGYQIFKLETMKPRRSSRSTASATSSPKGPRCASADRGPQVPRAPARQAIIEWKNEELKKVYEKQVALDTGGGAD